MSHLDLTDPALQMSFLPSTFQVIHLTATAPLPRAVIELLLSPPASPQQHPFLSVSQTAEERSLIIPTEMLMELEGEGVHKTEGYLVEGPWVVFKVQGPMELHMTGVMAAITEPLKQAQVAIFASSTWNTDYVLIHEEDKAKAEAALREAGWQWA